VENVNDMVVFRGAKLDSAPAAFDFDMTITTSECRLGCSWGVFAWNAGLGRNEEFPLITLRD
jgi:hypothetical protein